MSLLRAHSSRDEKSCAGAPQHKLKGKVRWFQKDACSFLTSCSRVVHGSGVSRFVCRGVRSCTGPKLVATRALPLSLCSLCPCSLCPLVHLDGGPHHLLCESPSLVVGAPLCARWCRRFCRPCGSWHPARSLGCHTWSPTGLVGFPVAVGFHCPTLCHRLCADCLFLHWVTTSSRRRTGTCTCGYPGLCDYSLVGIPSIQAL